MRIGTRDRGRAAAGAGRQPEGAHRIASTFVRGLTMGALAGAAVAGSLLFRRARHDRPGESREEDDGPIATPPR